MINLDAYRLKRTASMILLILLFAVGCGSTNEEIFFTTPPSDPGELNSVVIARLNVGDFTDVQGAEIRLLSHDGAELARGVADKNGHVHFEDIVVPENFKAVATVPNSETEFCAEIRGFKQNNKQARISLLTTLACHYRDLNPGLSIGEAETRLKEILAIPAVADIAIGPQTINPFFSDIAFFRAAATEGGIQALLTKRVDFANSTQGHRTAAPSRSFLLTIDQLDRPLPAGALDAGLTAEVEAARLNLAKRLNVAQATGGQLNLRYSPNISFVAGPTSLGGQFLLGIGTGLTTNVLNSGLNAVVGWAANQMGLNYGTAGQLEEIEGELNQLTSLVENFTQQYTTNTLTDSFNTITGYFESNSGGGADVKDDNANLKTALNSAAAPSSQPFVPPSNVVAINNSLRSNFTQNRYSGALNLANNQLSEQSGFLKIYQEAYTYDTLGLDKSSDAASLNLPWFSNHILGITNSMFEHFSLWQLQTLNLIAEAAHVYPNNPVQTYSVARDNIATGVSNLKSQRQLLPLYASQWGAITDLDNGIMWWEIFFAEAHWDTANNFANSLEVQLIFPDGSARTYDDWRLPNQFEFISLQNRGRYNPTFDSTVPVNSNNGVGDTGRSTAGLPSLGFYQVADMFNSEDTNEDDSHGNNGDLWMNFYQSEGGSTSQLETQHEFRLNHSENNTASKSSDTHNVYVLCRTFGPDAVTWPQSFMGPVPSSIAGSALVPGEILQYGAPQSISVTQTAGPSSVTFPPNAYAGTDQNVTLQLPSNSLQFVADVTYGLTIGGTFKVGASGNQHSYTNPSHSHTGTVSTTANLNNPNYLADLINWSSSNSNLLEVLNSPYVSGIGIPRTTTEEVTVTASLRGSGGSTISGQLQVKPTAAAPVVLESIQITPRNVTYGGSGLESSVGTPRFYVTGFYSDRTIRDLSLEVDWSVSPFPNASSAEIRTDSGGAFLNLSASTGDTTTFNLNVSASYVKGNGTTLTDSTVVEITPTQN